MNNKGFTLIELLAIIVILAIIAVITVPIILGIIDDASTKAAIDSAYGFKEGVQNFYVSKLLENQNEESPSAYKTVSSLTAEGLVVGGEMPSDGWVRLKKGEVIDYSLKFGDYVLSYDEATSSPVSIKNGEIGLMPEANLYRTVNNELVKINKSEMQSGDIVVLKLGDIEEKFIVISDSTHIDSKAPAGTTTLLAVNNINTSTGMQGENGQRYTVVFALTQYWQSDAADIYNSNTDKVPGDNDYSVAYYVKMYVQNLQNLGFTGVNSGRILKESEVSSGGIAASYKISDESYWLGSASTSFSVWCVFSSGNIIRDNYSSGNYGVRPVIYISTSDIQ